ncbi:flagellar assembly protein FliH [Malonomonas rubra DSM 5091]|uniref:Flagellar assembly protein FliH n=1 Tax=Malonomonas rubra DSM 5091 TaxID=1122189 RepID=A0A1M6MCY1_MALRU|nr:FliH/SctL family protein [Malonomonas rubra]SHJ81348.1 flagellar assembly protein FliH [Malonomonas rubra DSM 5091]
MSLSKVYRGTEAGDLREFRFRSFGEPAAAPGSEEDGSVTKAPPAPAAAAKAEPTAPAAPEVWVQQQIEEAYARGRQDGLNESEQRFNNSVQALTQALEGVSRLRESLAQAGRQDMLRLVMAVAEQVIRSSVAADPAVVLGIIENALQASVRSDNYRVRVNPVDLEAVTAQKPLFLASISGLKNISFEADPSISQGGCRLDSELGDVDATIETQLESIREALTQAISEG